MSTVSWKSLSACSCWPSSCKLSATLRDWNSRGVQEGSGAGDREAKRVKENLVCEGLAGADRGEVLALAVHAILLTFHLDRRKYLAPHVCARVCLHARTTRRDEGITAMRRCMHERGDAICWRIPARVGGCQAGGPLIRFDRLIKLAEIAVCGCDVVIHDCSLLGENTQHKRTASEMRQWCRASVAIETTALALAADQRARARAPRRYPTPSL